jgi:hypothetical protein
VLAGRDGVRVLGSDGRLVRGFGPHGRGPGELWNPRGIAIGGDTVFILDDAVKFFGLDGRYRGQLASTSGTYLTAHDIRYTNHGLATFRWRMQRPRGARQARTALAHRAPPSHCRGRISCRNPPWRTGLSGSAPRPREPAGGARPRRYRDPPGRGTERTGRAVERGRAAE